MYSIDFWYAVTRKNMIKKIIFIYAFICLIAFSQHSYNDDSAVLSLHADLLHQQLWAQYLHLQQKPDLARHLYENIICPQTPIETHTGYIRLLFDQGEYKKITELESQYRIVFQKEIDIERIFALSLEKIGKTTEAAQRFIELNKQFKTHADIALRVTQYYLTQNQPQQALMIIDTLLNNAPQRQSNFLFYFLKSQIHSMLHQLEEARTSINTSISLNPYFDRSWLLSAVIEEQLGSIQHAINAYSNFLQTSTIKNETIHDHLMQLLLKQQLLTNNTVNTQKESMNLIDYAITLFNKNLFDAALTSVEKILVRSPQDIQARLLKLQILQAQNKPKRALGLLKSWIEETPHIHLWYKMVHLIGKSQAFKSAIHIFQEIEQKYPDEPFAILYLADIYLRTEKLSLAKKYLTRAESKIIDPELKARILFQKGFLYYTQEKHTLAKSSLEQAYKLLPHFPPVLNLLAYYAVMSHDFSVAQDYITQALQKEPRNPHFLDTQALILYKQEKYDQALAILEKITTLEAKDFNILKLFGKTLHKLGNYDRAIEVMESAQLAALNKKDRLCSQKYLECWNLHEE